jgi:TPP-dependent 2-oxoacid decarboxylase
MGIPAEEPRTVPFVGEGSLQVTVQALSDTIREKLNMVSFVINNNGYTIERCIHGRKQSYNDVAPWKYLLAPVFFGGLVTARYDWMQRFAQHNLSLIQQQRDWSCDPDSYEFDHNQKTSFNDVLN